VSLFFQAIAAPMCRLTGFGEKDMDPFWPTIVTTTDAGPPVGTPVGAELIGDEPPHLTAARLPTTRRTPKASRFILGYPPQRG
jgi:hypothetical protein